MSLILSVYQKVRQLRVASIASPDVRSETSELRAPIGGLGVSLKFVHLPFTHECLKSIEHLLVTLAILDDKDQYL